MAEGDELPPVVAALVGDDASFLEMIARDVELADQFKTDMQAALGGSAEITGSVTGIEGAEEIPAEMAEVGAEAGAEFSTAFGERAQEEAAVTAEDWAAYNQMFTPVGAEAGDAYAEGITEATSSIPEQISEMLRQGLDEQAQALMDQLPSVVEGPAAAAGKEIGATLGEGVAEGFEATVEVVEESAVEFVDTLVAMTKAGALTAAQAIDVLAGDEVRTTASMNQSLAALNGTWAAATAALADYGTAEAVAAGTTAVLADAQDELLGSGTSLMLMYQQLAAGAEMDAEDQVNALGALADAQAGVTSATRAQIAAMTELNFTAIQGDGAFMDETAAFDGMRAASIQLGLGLDQVAEELRAGTYAMTDNAAAQAEAAIKANLLVEAQQRLAAANLTLVQTYQQLDDGVAVSSEAQMAALAGMTSAQKEVTGLGGALGGLEKDTEEAAHGFGDLGSIMYGPVGMGLMGLMMVLPMLGGMFSSNAVSAADFTSAVTQDSNAVGDNTASTIQATLAKTNLGSISQTLGLSQAQLIEYASGEANVQNQVAQAYDAKTAALQKSVNAQGATSPEAGREAGYELNRLKEQKAALDAVTAAVQQAVAEDAANSAALLAAEQTTQIYNASVDALGESQLLQVQQTQMANQATVEYGDRMLAAEQSVQYMKAAVGAAGVQMELQANSTLIANEATVAYGAAVMGAYRDATMFNSAIDASYVSMQMQAQTSSIASVGLLNLGDSQSNLNRTLVYAEESYTQAQEGANAYNSVLTALDGTTNTLLGDEASFTIALGGLTTAVSANGKSLDQTNTKGAENIQTITQISTAANAAAVAVYQNEVANQGATKAYADANTKLAQEKQAFIDAADKAGLNKNAVQQLANELFKLPPSITTAINVNTGGAQASLNELLSLEAQVASTGAHVATQEFAGHRAAGGPVQAGLTYLVGEHGPEPFTPSTSGYVTPHEAMPGAGGGGGGYSPAYGGGGQAPQVHVTVLLDSREITATTRSDAQQYKTRNSGTGFN